MMFQIAMAVEIARKLFLDLAAYVLFFIIKVIESEVLLKGLSMRSSASISCPG